MIELGNHEHGVRIAGKARCQFHPETSIVLSHSKHGALLGGAIYQDFTGASINLHIGAFDKRWLNRDMLFIMFDYPFRQLGVGKIIGQVAERNLSAIYFGEHLGFNKEARVKDVFFDGDLIVMSMYRANCPWLHLKSKTIKRRISDLHAAPA